MIKVDNSLAFILFFMKNIVKMSLRYKKKIS